MPLKDAVRRAEVIAEGDPIDVHLVLGGRS